MGLVVRGGICSSVTGTTVKVTLYSIVSDGRVEYICSSVVGSLEANMVVNNISVSGVGVVHVDVVSVIFSVVL